MKGLDLSKFKKTSSDKHSTTLTHEDGHELRVAHWGLSSKMKKQLTDLPTTDAKSKFKKMAEGGPVIDPDKAKAMSSTIRPTATDQALTQAVQHPIDTAKKVLGFAGGGDVTPLVDPDSVGVGAPVPDSSKVVAPDSDSLIPTAPDERAPVNVPNSPMASPQAPAPAGGDWSGSAGNMAQDSAALPPTPDAQPTAPQAPAQQPQPVQHPVAAASADPKQQTFDDLSKHVQDFQMDLDEGHIQPKTYNDLFENKGTLGKIGTIFGMMIGGMGAGLAHQPNMLLEMMNKEIGNDLEAQKTSAANKQNWYKLNLEHTMNQAQVERMGHENKLTDQQAQATKVDAATKAYALTRAQMNAAALHQLTQQVQQLPMGSPQRAQAEQTLAMMSQAAQGENYSILDRAAAQSAYFKQIMGTGAQDPNNPETQFQNRTRSMRMLGAGKMAEDLESKHMPGLQGQASVPLTTEDRTQLNSGIQFGQQAERMRDWIKQNSGTLNPAKIKEGQALAAELQGSFRAASNGGVYKEGEQHFISKLIDSDPTKFFAGIRTLPQLNAIVKENQAKVDQLAKSKGFSGYTGSGGQSQPQSGGEIERLDPKSGRTVVYDAATKKPLRWK